MKRTMVQKTSSRAGGSAAQKSPQKRMTQAERVAMSDQRMMSAAMQLIAKHGTHGTTLKDIGQLAGYSRALAGIRFGTKEALFSKLITAFHRRWREESDLILKDARGLDAFRVNTDALISFVNKEPLYVRAMYVLWFEAIGSSSLIHNRLADYHQRYRKTVETWIADALADGTVNPKTSPEGIAMQHCSFFFGLIYQWLVSPDSIDVTRTLKDFREAMLNVMSVKHESKKARSAKA